MKKLLNISVIAALAVLPMAANATAADVDKQPSAIDMTAQGAETTASNATATAAPKYELATSHTTDSNVATAGYVKGAYNATIRAINKVSETATNAADKDLSNLSGTGKSNVSAQGTVDLTKNDYGTGTVGKALVDIKTTADSAASKDLNNLSAAGTGVITTAVTTNAASGAFTSSAGLTSTTLGEAIDEVAGTAGNAADKSLSNIDGSGENVIKGLAAEGGYDSSETYGSGTIGEALQGKANSATTLAGYGITDAYTKTETATGVLATIDAATVPVMATWGSNTATTVSVDAPANYLEGN